MYYVISATPHVNRCISERGTLPLGISIIKDGRSSRKIRTNRVVESAKY